ncbi:hypothetical protein [Maridesulfovibrio ferrireducens]|uniref:hypothetical protein n=1 Tax=Maridesulfovibrio ferrireducens TaxID=246191 RepID=UPI001A1B7F8C|nr:hypothetical protein [Maridesulfovibrio ferrireducens]MBI9112791.1 hypothetical protein [Maridesulfovibrio ferrireducens]
MSFLKLCSQMIALTLVVLLTASVAMAVQATGEGIDRHQALNSALRTAVEMEIGTAIASDTLVESGVLVRDEIVSHSRGYVTSFAVISEGATAQDGYTITIDADVNRELLFDDYRTISILQKMSGHPRLLIFGSGSGFNSVPAESMKKLIHSVAQVFGQKFQFEVIDWPVARAKFSSIEGSMSVKKALKYNNLLKADYVVTVDLDLPPNKKPTMLMSCVRISDQLKIGEVRKTIATEVDLSGKPAVRYENAVDAARPEVYWASVSIAKKMLEYMETELDRGEGFRYAVTFIGFPDVSVIGTAVEDMPGFVRKHVKRQSTKNMEMVYWSTLPSDTLMNRLERTLRDIGVEKFKSKRDGRNLKFLWVNPEGF